MARSGPAAASVAAAASSRSAQPATTAAATAATAGGAAAALSFIPASMMTEFLTSGVSVSAANTATNPLDVIKVRLQMERGRTAGLNAPRVGMVQTGLSVVRNEGVAALWSGLGPSLARGFFFGGARLGLYTPIKTVIAGDVPVQSLSQKILAGSLSGGLAAAATSPIELVKTRMQAAGRTAGGGAPPQSALGIVRGVMAVDGVAGLWKGAMPGLVRSSILTAAQCATYDEIKRRVRTLSGWGDGLPLHLTSSMASGLVSTTITNPIDVVKTRMFMGGSRYSGPLACAASVWRADGVAGFFKGWSASYARLGPHTVIMFLAAENLRSFAGLKSL